MLGICRQISSQKGESLVSSRRSRRFFPTRAEGGSSEGIDTSLVNWVVDKGGSVSDAIQLTPTTDQGYGLSTGRSIAAGDKLIFLPKSAILTYNLEGGDDHPGLVTLINQVPEDLWGAKLGLRLLRERCFGQSSSFWPYISALPSGIHGLPIFYDGPTLKALQYPYLIDQVLKRCQFLAEFSVKYLEPAAVEDPSTFNSQTPDINAFGWSLAAVSSRAFRVYGPRNPAGLLPLIDMCNHTFDPNCKVRLASGGLGVDLVAIKPLDAGTPLTLCYGELPNDFLLLDYGFVDPTNPYDAVKLAFSSVVDSVVATAEDEDQYAQQPKPWQIDLIAQLGLTRTSEVEIGGGSKDPIGWKMLAATRILCATNQAQVRGRELRSLGDISKPLTDGRSERRARRVLASICALALASFPTTSEEDEAELQACEPTDGDLKLAIRFRMGKKRILVNAIRAIAELAAGEAVEEVGIKQSGWKKNKNKPGSGPKKSKGFGGSSR